MTSKEPAERSSTTFRLLGSISEVDAGAWDACLGPGNPFVRHDFLAVLEESGCATAAAGWRPAHLVLDGPARPAGAAPAWLKSHSYGEYVFDWDWADAYARAGGRYYPKLQVAVPFTPVPGRRLGGPVRLLGRGLVEAVRALGVSSAHVTFCLEEEARELEALGFLTRMGLQFHWENRGYGSFEDFLEALVSRKRKSIRRERREVAEAGLRFRELRGDEIGEAEWDAFYRFYMDTGSRKWGSPYLNRRFFSTLGRRMPEAVVLFLAYDPGGRCVAGALNLLGEDALYGRYWGSLVEAPFLHFETCYYRAIDFAIRHGLKRVEAGAQGSHKLQRGYLARPTWSAHWLDDPALRQAVARFLEVERVAIARQVQEAPSPFRGS